MLCKKKFETFPEIEPIETLLFWSKQYKTKKPSISIETKNKGVQSHRKSILEEYKNYLGKNKV